MLEILVWKNALECTSQHLTRTSGARVMTQQTLKQYVDEVNVNKVNIQVNVNKVNVKVNVNKVNDKLNDIYSIHSHYKYGGRWPPP